MGINKKEIGQILKEARVEKGYTLSQVANLSGVSQPYLSQIETGKRQASPEVLKKLSSVLDIFYTDLLKISGYDEILDVIGPIEAIADFSNWGDVANMAARLKTYEQIEDIKIFIEQKLLALKAEGIKPRYNGHLLTEEDCRRILIMLEVLFPEYQQKKD